MPYGTWVSWTNDVAEFECEVRHVFDVRRLSSRKMRWCCILEHLTPTIAVMIRGRRRSDEQQSQAEKSLFSMQMFSHDRSTSHNLIARIIFSTVVLSRCLQFFRRIPRNYYATGHFIVLFSFEMYGHKPCLSKAACSPFIQMSLNAYFKLRSQNISLPSWEWHGWVSHYTFSQRDWRKHESAHCRSRRW